MATKASNTINGKAFEYACLTAVREKLQTLGKDVILSETAAFNTAMKAFEALDGKKQERYMMAATTAVKMINGLEPRLLNGGGSLVLEISPDAAAVGSEGDVRDVLCIRTGMKDGEWQIGLSCKHNHEALKHPRITEKKDFGTDWMSIPCSQAFMDEISPVIDPLIQFEQDKVLWRNLEKKFDTYYVPILQAYINEIRRMCANNSDVPAKLLSYFFGSNDFYKVIMNEGKNTTIVEGFNMHGTLNKKCGRIAPTTVVTKIDLPQRLIEADFKKSKKGVISKTTIVLTFDGGWAVSMRLHNKDDIAKPTSLAWDVNLVGLPPKTYVNTRSWFEE